MQQKILKWSLLAAIVLLIFDAIISGIPRLLYLLWDICGFEYMSLYGINSVFGYFIPLNNDIFQILLIAVGGLFIYLNRKNILPMVGGGLIILQALIAMLINLLQLVFHISSQGYFTGDLYLVRTLILSIIIFAAFAVLSFHYKDKVMGLITAVYAVIKFYMIVLLIVDRISHFMYSAFGMLTVGAHGLLVLVAEVAFLGLWFRKINEPQLTD